MGYKDQVRGSLDGSPGFMIRAEGMPHRTSTPSWDHETRIRIFPASVASGFSPMRESLDNFDFGDAVWSEPIARCLGVQEQFTYITRIPGKTGDDPTRRFCQAILSIIDEKPRDVPEAWIAWPKKGKKISPKIDRIKNGIFFQGMQIMQQGKLLTNSLGQPHPQWPVLFMGSISLKMSFEESANLRVEGYQGPLPSAVQGTGEAARQQRDAIYAQMFAIGDWCSLEGGRILSIFQAPPSGKFERPHYAVKALEPLPLTQITAQVRNVWKPWSEVLRYHTAEEQITYLSRAFPAEAVDYVFGNSEYRDAMPVRVKDAWRNYQALQRGWSPGVGAGVGAVQPGQTAFDASVGTGAPPPTGGPLQSAAPSSAVPPPPQAQLQVQLQAQSLQNPTTVTPAQPGATVVSGYDLGGGTAGMPSSDSPIMGSGAFATTPVEFAQTPVIAGAAPSVSPTAPTPGTPPEAAAGGAVDGSKLSAALTDLKRSREAAARGNLGG